MNQSYIQIPECPECKSPTNPQGTPNTFRCTKCRTLIEIKSDLTEEWWCY